MKLGVLIPCDLEEEPGKSLSRRNDIVEMSILPKVIYILNTIPIKIPVSFFIKIEKNNPKIHMGPQKAMNSQSNLEQEEHARAITLSDFKVAQ